MEEIIDNDQYKSQRLADLQLVPNSYPHSFKTSTTLEKFRNQYEYLKSDEILESSVERIAGRIQTIRTAGSKLFFVVIESDGIFLQVLANAKFYADIESFQRDKRLLRRGDIIGVVGVPTRSSKGELSILPKIIQLLAPCLYNIPKDSANSLLDDGLRFEKRYLDFILHPEKRQIFKTRAKILSSIRKYLDDKDFIEVDTPIISTKLGGANAKPFVTYHNDFNREMYLRVAPELYLKQLVIGGLEKVYEMGKQFRNENSDKNHSPEFTSIEIYQAYADYTDMMKITEELLSQLVFKINGSYLLKYNIYDEKNNMTKEVLIDCTPPFKRLDLITDLEKMANFIFPKEILLNFATEDARHFLINVCSERNVKCSEPKTTARLLDKLVGQYLEPLCINPTFIMNHPQIMSPLAKYHHNNKFLTERFELFIYGTEYVNSYTELNDPHIQKTCFEKQAKDKELGDAEAQITDNDYIEALEYGLPPTGGLGIGIDRLIMLLTNQSMIKEVITFRSY